MPLVKVHRKNQFADRLRAYEIIVDGEVKNIVRAGRTAEFYLPKGLHRIRLKIDWCGSREIEFNLGDDETAEFDCGNNTKLFLELFYVFFARNDYLWLEKRT
jgi:hypothetical protein